MAVQADIDALRLLIGEPGTDPYTDAILGVMIDTAGSLNAAAYTAWLQKAARYSDAVDISEGGSQRKNSDLYKNALEMVNLYAGLAAAGDGRTRINKLVRT